ncbi:MAG: hydantoinase B/oxoprolinase family protein [Alphaproteobacteria bacterium]|jgi:N-methylhydantoinase B|nr:hydantoinase B/oxoprolinase family protein [Alphaproteobacteria bacterium]MDA8675299.1 hydantoinase B/oxoprolinase family protein [Alphaproteobacteria bacterium]MDG2466114.1 hydantoinase B/oxoprolinase family protein [Alphaproteobacteria bacterium]
MSKANKPKKLGPIELEVIHGTIRAAELEIEAAVERTARSPMIRDQHDYRVALFDAKGRKLTGRSYSAIVEPVFEYFGKDNIFPGDVFFWNDPYNSCGGIGHVPDLCTTVPIFHEDRLIGFSQVFGHHDDVGGSVPGSLPVHATDSWMEGLLVPPIKMYDRGVLNQAAFNIVIRNSRLSDHLAGDMDAEIGAAKLGSRRIVALAERYGIDTLEMAFDEILSNTAEIFRREIFPKIENGTYHYEDYIENDGVDESRLHALRVTMTKTSEKITLDFTGTDPEARGPINWAIDEMDGRYFRKWMAPILRSLADTPERAAEIDCNEGVLDVIDVIFPEKGTLITPTFGKPTGMRFFLMLRTLGVFAACLTKASKGKMPADHETIRIWGLAGGNSSEDFFLFREVLGGGGPGRPWADGSDVVHIVPNSRNLPAEFSETRYPIFIEKLGLKEDSAGPGYRRGGFGYDKQIKTLSDVRLISNADRSVLSCYGSYGGKAGRNYQVSVINKNNEDTNHPGMCDTVKVEADDSVRIVTTGGGGWGDPLKREAEKVVYDLQCGLISEASALNDYGVVVSKQGRKWSADLEKTEQLRAKMRDENGHLAMFDRGEAFTKLKNQGKINYPEGWTDPDEGWLV